MINHNKVVAFVDSFVIIISSKNVVSQCFGIGCG